MESKVIYDIFHLVYWDWRVAVDFFLGGIGVGAFIYAISMMVYKNNDRLASVKVGSALGPIAMSAGLLILLTEMGQPFRIYKTLTRFNLTSTMSWGGILQEGFILLSAIFAIMLFTNRNEALRRNVGIFAGFFALFVAYYHGFLLSFTTARPLWNAGAVSVGLVLSSVTTGIVAVLIVASFSNKGREEIRQISLILKNSLLVLLLAQISTGMIWIITLLTGKYDFVNAYHVMNQQFGLPLWLGSALIGLVFPFLILLICSIGARRNKPIPVFLISIPILIGALIFRYVLILAGQIS